MNVLLERTTRFANIVAVAVAVTALAVLAYGLRPQPPMVHISAEFPRTVGLYVGSDVRVLGVAIGKVDAVVPHGRTVRVEMTYEKRNRVPAGAKAAIVSPSVVSDRYVQLTPVYSSGPVMKDGTRIPRDRTAVPVELDQVYASLDRLATALGPNGANKHGALSRLLRVGAKNLDGQGKNAHRTVHDLADAVGTVAGKRQDLFATVRQLQDFTSALAADDTRVRRFNSDLAEVAGQLSGERHDLRAALSSLAVALDQVASFVRDNRAELRTNVHGLADLSKTLVKQQDALREVLDEAPVALQNLNRTYNPATGTLDTRQNFNQVSDPGRYLCSLLLELGQPRSVCTDLRSVLDQLPDLPPIPGGPSGRAAPPAGTRDLTLGGILGRSR